MAELRFSPEEQEPQIDKKAADTLAQRSASRSQGQGTPAPVSEVLDTVVGDLRKQFDPIHGGFGTAPKFPLASVHDLVLYRFQETGDGALREMLTRTLDSMQERAVFDRDEGGFFHYAVDRDWNRPHYEKMLEGNALLLANYLRAAHALGDPSYRETARRVMAYLERTLLDEATGAFFGSQDAGEAYYRLSGRLSGPDRERAAAPAVDRTIYAGWNGLAASAFALASWVLDQPDALVRAKGDLEFLWEHLRGPDDLLVHSSGGRPQGPVLLSDQVLVGLALLDLCEATGRSGYLSRATALATAVVREFHDAAAGGFWDIGEVREGQDHPARRDKPVEENAWTAEFLQRLSLATGEPRYGELAAEALRAVAQVPRVQPGVAATYALACLRVQEEPVHIVIPGDPDDPRTQALQAAGLRLRHPHRLVQTLHPEQDAGLLEMLGYLAGPQPQAYVCYHFACSPPLHDPNAIPQAVERLTHAGTLTALSPGSAPAGGPAGLKPMPFVTLTPPVVPKPQDG